MLVWCQMTLLLCPWCCSMVFLVQNQILTEFVKDFFVFQKTVIDIFSNVSSISSLIVIVGSLSVCSWLGIWSCSFYYWCSINIFTIIFWFELLSGKISGVPIIHFLFDFETISLTKKLSWNCWNQKNISRKTDHFTISNGKKTTGFDIRLKKSWGKATEM